MLRGTIFLAVFAVCTLVLPGPLAGYWRSDLTDCLCSSKNLVAFRNGTVYFWSSAHGAAGEEVGEYRRRFLWVDWMVEGDKYRVWPGWLFMLIFMPEQPPYTDSIIVLGFRELRPGFIREALATEPQPARPVVSAPESKPVP